MSSSVAYNRMPQSLLVLNDRVQNVTYRSLHADNTLTLRGKVLGLYVKNELDTNIIVSRSLRCRMGKRKKLS